MPVPAAIALGSRRVMARRPTVFIEPRLLRPVRPEDRAPPGGVVVNEHLSHPGEVATEDGAVNPPEVETQALDVRVPVSDGTVHGIRICRFRPAHRSDRALPSSLPSFLCANDRSACPRRG